MEIPLSVLELSICSLSFATPTSLREYLMDWVFLLTSLLERIAKLYSFHRFIMNASSVDDTVNEIALAWHEAGGRFLYVASTCNENLSLRLISHGWFIIILRSLGQELAEGIRSGEIDNSSVIYIDKLEELPSTICHFNRKVMGNDHVTVGYIMKPSREADFAKRGAFPWYPTESGLIFMPITFELNVSSQLEEVDVILHKSTDEIISVEKGISSEFLDKITYTRGIQELERYIESHPFVGIVDPLNKIVPVLDRLQIQQILLDLGNLNMEARCKIRGPHFLKVDNFDEADLAERLLAAKLTPPSIVKPQVACGVPDAHSMAIVFRAQDYSSLNVPLPAVVQEFVDHSCTIFKFYVLGERIFYAVKKSIPNANSLAKLSEKNGLKPLLFDSLKSLPDAKENEDHQKTSHLQLDLALATDAACWLRKRLDLTIFGFDVVIQETTGDHVIVDVNYLPSFKEVPDDVAIPAFWEAIKSKYKLRRINEATGAAS
ncbi:inositol 1,3,4-trisphosphate 5/6-kinase 4 isoform X2 [Diospyros lotus]|uniref:inositol 1,3,4-trisphosphate 5/6-kinase 4 isoform X2 n=1 Tax=Diospyros lotus TaxID=55363 RepID=UPI002252D1F6|nr:inositol 1,3,4-trisphosphate 5/6-kinase 4 isoform X2 [Diospyros lotus]